MTELYYTFDNGAKPYVVNICYTSEDADVKVAGFDDPIVYTVSVYKNIPDNSNISDNSHDDSQTVVLSASSRYLNNMRTLQLLDQGNHLLCRFEVSEYFVGDSPKTENSYRGNSILVKLNNEKNKYVFIGHTIFSFVTEEDIVDFVSPVGNSDVPYPYAIDDKNRCYLMVESVMIGTDSKDLEHWNSNNPYDHYYSVNLLTSQNSFVVPKQPVHKHFRGIDTFYINNRIFTLIYSPTPEKEFDRLTSSFGEDGKSAVLTIEDVYGAKRDLSKEQFVIIMKEFGKLIDCKEFKTENPIKVNSDKVKS